ncbi:MAG: NB-ARC domain-containing protein [Chloroflexia bacterium]
MSANSMDGWTSASCLSNAVEDRRRLVAVLGIGGVGKTTLVAHTAAMLAPRFERVFWRSLLNAPPFEQVVRACLKFLSDRRPTSQPEDPDEWLRLLLAELGRRRCLIVLDNLESVTERETGAYRPGYEA